MPVLIFWNAARNKKVASPRTWLAAATLTSGLISLVTLAHAADTLQYPTRPIRFIVPFPPAGGNDIVGRIVAVKLSEILGQPVVIDNRAGAGGVIGTDITAKASPDGHTMLIHSISLAINATLFRKLPYDTVKDLEPVTTIGKQPNILLVHPSVPAKSVAELLALARSKPGGINYGTGGVGTTSHLSTELLKLMAKIDLVHVPYKGLGPSLTALMGGEVQLLISGMASALPHIRAGRLRPLAVTTMKRSPMFPEMPTLDEAGVPGYEFSAWYGLLVPAGTPKRISRRLNDDMATILNSSMLKEQFAVQGLEPTASSSGQFAAFIKAEIEKWGKVIAASGAKAD